MFKPKPPTTDELYERISALRERVYYIETKLKEFTEIYNRHDHQVDFQQAAIVRLPNQKV